MTVLNRLTKHRASIKRHRRNNHTHGKVKQKHVKKPLNDEMKDIDSYNRAQKLALLTILNPRIHRKPIHNTPAKLTLQQRRERWKITTNIPIQRQEEIDKYLRNVERGHLRISHDGADVTRQITAEQVAKFLECKDCQVKPIVSFQFKKRLVGLCGRHWGGLAETVIGWSGG